MEQFDIALDGIEETLQMLDEAPRNVVASGFMRALQAGGTILADAIAAAAPVKSEATGGLLARGELRESVRLKVTLDSAFRGGVAEIDFGHAGPVAYWMEYGHRLVKHGATWEDRKNNYRGKLLLRRNPETFDSTVPPHPVVRKPLDTSWEAAVDAVVESLKETLVAEYPQSSAA
jgi:hypothetical protein